MYVLVACEESQAVCKEFRKRGHTAFSCDIIECSGGFPQWHIKQDVLSLLNGCCSFETADGTEHFIPGKWDLIIAFPPCTYLTTTGNKYFNVDKYGEKAIERARLRESGAEFFMQIVNADCEHIAIENPVGVMSTRYRKPNQVIQPFYFGEPYEKRTCLWLKNLPELVKTDVVKIPDRVRSSKSSKTMGKWYYETSCLPRAERAMVRSKTPAGVARAMCEQWCEYLENEVKNK